MSCEEKWIVYGQRDLGGWDIASFRISISILLSVQSCLYTCNSSSISWVLSEPTLTAAFFTSAACANAAYKKHAASTIGANRKSVEGMLDGAAPECFVFVSGDHREPFEVRLASGRTGACQDLRKSTPNFFPFLLPYSRPTSKCVLQKWDESDKSTRTGLRSAK